MNINFKDITGQKFGKLTVSKRLNNNRHGKTLWNCRCDCGKEIVKLAMILRRKRNNVCVPQSCGCSNLREKQHLCERLIGHKFNKLTVLSININKGRTCWLCKCDCGNITSVPTYRLTSGKTKSCGCICLKGAESPHWNGYGEISRRYWTQIKRGAKIRNLSFNITIENAWNLFSKQNRKCALTGLELKFGGIKLKRETTASLDRIDSLKGYELNNVQWVHKDINWMKNDLPQSQFISFCKQVAAHN